MNSSPADEVGSAPQRGSRWGAGTSDRTSRLNRIPLHRSLVGKLLATSILIAGAATAATAWLVAQSTTYAVRQQQDRSYADDKSVYHVVVGYAATHSDWSGVRQTVDTEAKRIGRRVTLTDNDGDIIADSDPGIALASIPASATINPLQLDPVLSGNTQQIDPRAVGPYRLSASERTKLRVALSDEVRCFDVNNVDALLTDDAGGRPMVQTSTPPTADSAWIFAFCSAKFVDRTMPTEKRALSQLEALTGRCLGLTGASHVVIGRDFTVKSVGDAPSGTAPAGDSAARAAACLQRARLEQLRPYVAPQASLFVTDVDDGPGHPTFRLSPATVLRIVGATAAVLIVTVALTVVTGRRLIRPLQALTEAAMSPTDHRRPMPVTGNDEISYLANALNGLAQRREHAEELRRLMVNDVAHELRTPLTNISVWLEAAQDDLIPTDPAFLKMLHHEAAWLRHIINDLSDLAAADAGQLKIYPDIVYLGDFVIQICEIHGSTAERSHLELSSEVHGDPVVFADPVRLRQILGNLLSNAIRYTPAGGRITMIATADADTVTIAVRDTGTGISPAELPKIFDRFWRADTSRTRATGGSGLGLSIARDLVEAHGGTLSATSQPGNGTTMTVRLPMNLPTEAPDHYRAPTVPK